MPLPKPNGLTTPTNQNSHDRAWIYWARLAQQLAHTRAELGIQTVGNAAWEVWITQETSWGRPCQRVRVQTDWRQQQKTHPTTHTTDPSKHDATSTSTQPQSTKTKTDTASRLSSIGSHYMTGPTALRPNTHSMQTRGQIAPHAHRCVSW